MLRVRGRRVVGLLLGILGLAMALAAAMLAGPPIAWRVGYAIGGALVTAGGHAHPDHRRTLAGTG